MTTAWRLAQRWVVLLMAAALAACAGVLPQLERAPSFARPAVTESALGSVARDASIPPTLSGVRALPQAAFALDARMAMIEQAQMSLDVQYYVIGNDTTGRMLLRALRDAARRGVRVRLLLDDMHTAGMDPLLQGLAAEPNIELRLFNPFVYGREAPLLRLFALAADFSRLNRRMHNKLLIADGALAVVGGRNLADEYFLRSRQSNFIDFDLLLAGAVLPRLAQLFDLYWNSAQAFELGRLARSGDSRTELQTAFDSATRGDPFAQEPQQPPATDIYGHPPFSIELASRSFHFIAAPTSAFADAPNKGGALAGSVDATDTLAQRTFALLHEARSEVLLISPYFIPGQAGLERMREARRAGIAVRVVTNSLAASDAPVVNTGYERYRMAMLQMGVELFEVSPSRLKREKTLRSLLGNSSARLHAKIGFIDRRTVLVGSMNLDPRSVFTNTEIGVAVRSPELAAMIITAYKVDSLEGVYQVSLAGDGTNLQWTALNDDTPEVLDEPPEASLWQRLQIFILSTVVPEALL